MTSTHYNKQLPKVFSLIEQWRRRILIPIGRITVVKSLIILKLTPYSFHFQIQNKMPFHLLLRACLIFLEIKV